MKRLRSGAFACAVSPSLGGEAACCIVRDSRQRAVIGQTSHRSHYHRELRPELVVVETGRLIRSPFREPTNEAMMGLRSNSPSSHDVHRDLPNTNTGWAPGGAGRLLGRRL
jgi:hypothetical protein